MSDALKRISAMAELFVRQQAAVSAAEETLAAAKEDFLRTSREDLPMLMEEVGLKEIRLPTGELVSIAEDFDAGITENNREAALKWLADNGFGGLIKTSVVASFGRGEREKALEIEAQLRASDCVVQMTEGVHHSTLKAFLREQLAAGAAFPMETFNVFPYSKATIKLPRSTK
jgi:hypothetical protein